MSEQNDNIIKSLGIETLPDEQKARILDQSNELIQQRLLLRLMEALPDEKRTQLNEVLASQDQDKLAGFISANAPNFSDWIIEEVNGLRSELGELGQVD